MQNSNDKAVFTSNRRIQNMLSLLVLTLLVTQTVLLILVLVNLKSLSRVILTKGAMQQEKGAAHFINVPAPDFKLSDVEGNPISLSAYEGKPVLLVFTSHQCSFCREIYAHLHQFLESDPAIEVLMLSLSGLRENQAFQDEYQFGDYKNLHILSATAEVFEKYDITGVPTFVVIDETGRIARIGYAATPEQIVELTNQFESN